MATETKIKVASIEKVLMFKAALANVKIGKSLYEPTCLFFDKPEAEERKEVLTPVRNAKAPSPEPACKALTGSKPVNPKKSFYYQSQ